MSKLLSHWLVVDKLRFEERAPPVSALEEDKVVEGKYENKGVAWFGAEGEGIVPRLEAKGNATVGGGVPYRLPSSYDR